MKFDKNNTNLQQSKKKPGFPGGFLLFVVAVVFIILVIQSLVNDKQSKVFFGYQLEHLVNLDLINPDENYKIAQNDNLVAFGGKFREKESQIGTNRFNYLTLLNKKYKLEANKNTLNNELKYLKNNIKETIIYFIEITGIQLDKSQISFFNNNDILINSENIVPLNFSLYLLKNDILKNDINVDVFADKLNLLLQAYSSYKLGIGNELLKNEFRSLKQNLEDSKNVAISDKLVSYKNIIFALEKINLKLVSNTNANGIPFTDFRNIRDYIEVLGIYNVVSEDIYKNESLLNKSRQNVLDVMWFFNNEEISTKMLEKQNSEIFNNWFIKSKKEWDDFSYNKGLIFKVPDQTRNLVLERTFKSQVQSPNYFNYIFTILPIALVIFIIYFIFTKQMKGMGSSAMNFGKSPARLLTKESNHITFKDVAGAKEAKEELEEVVDFLKDPKKFTILGARIPKGVLLVGPPGTGKTLVAKAVAGEADRPFFSISGSDFVEMFVGVGASRIRDLFDQAKKNAPCIIFMDEIDAVGRHRGAGIGGGHDEREQTLNQLLVEMDGFDTKEGVILMAATNRPDILDNALLRPGRFDRRVMLDLPDVRGRFEILKVHARKIKIDDTVNLMDIARNTVGASGADLENILNESALLAARRGRSAVTASETIESCDKVRFGKERRSLEMDKQEKYSTACHEAGHTIIGLIVKNSDPVDKVTIIPRGFSLGATHFLPKKNKLNYWKKELLDQLCIMMGGRIAEEIFLSDVSSGAQQDIVEATKLARAMVCKWGMSDELGVVAYDKKEGANYYSLNNNPNNQYSEVTAEKIDKAISDIIKEAYKKATDLIKENKDKVLLIAEMLIEFETLDAQDLKEIIEDDWNSDKKREKMLKLERLHKKPPPPPIIKDIKNSDDKLTPQEG